MKDPSTQYIPPFAYMIFLRITHLAFFLFLASCAPTLSWIPDPSPLPSCQPNRLPLWSDFLPHEPEDKRAAETAIRFLHHPSQHRLSMALDSEHSWVKPDLIDPANMTLWKISEHLLAHEQLHFLISCLIVRQANFSITEQDNLTKMLELTKLVAQRLNLEYDNDTNHGVNLDAQRSWEREVMNQFQTLSSYPFPPSSNEKTEAMKF